MGNCQASEAATLAVQHPDGRLDRYYWSMRSKDVMAANPGHYVASIITYNTTTTTFADTPSPPYRYSSDKHAATTGAKGRPVRYVKLLGPDDTLLVGHFYRLVSFEEVLRVFGSKKRVRLSKLLAKEEGRRRRDAVADALGGDRASPPSSMMEEQEEEQQRWGNGVEGGRSISMAVGIKMPKHAQWRPTLQSIAEVGV